MSVKSDPALRTEAVAPAPARPAAAPLKVPHRAGRTHQLGALLTAWWRAGELDHRLAAGTNPRASPALAIRARRLTSPRTRRRLAAGLAQALRSAETSTPAFSDAIAPACREVLAARTVLDTLQRRLLGSEPVTPKGAAMLLELLTDGASPLYLYLHPGRLGSQLRAAAAALEVPGRSSPDLAETSVLEFR